MLIVIIGLLELFFVGLDWFTGRRDNKCITGMYSSDVSICAFCSLGSYSILNYLVNGIPEFARTLGSFRKFGTRVTNRDLS